jgi:hypothetical protein
MSKLAYTVVSMLIVTASAFGGFYWGARPLAKNLHISEFATGFDLFLLIAICVFCSIIGLIAGLFLYLLILRPISSAAGYWSWAKANKTVQVPVLSQLLQRWTRLLYGDPRP